VRMAAYQKWRNTCRRVSLVIVWEPLHSH
jgi:hypothetical protein